MCTIAPYSSTYNSKTIFPKEKKIRSRGSKADCLHSTYASSSCHLLWFLFVNFFFLSIELKKKEPLTNPLLFRDQYTHSKPIAHAMQKNTTLNIALCAKCVLSVGVQRTLFPSCALFWSCRFCKGLICLR